MTQRLLEVKDLKVDIKIRGKYVTAVEDVQFEIEEGKTLCIVGESGCGKSVTATAILQLFPNNIVKISDASSVKLEGEELIGAPNKKIREIRGDKVSMIFQEPMTSLNPVYRIGTQLIEMIQAHNKISKKRAFDRGVEMLAKVGIPSPEARMKEYPHQLSGGMKQRVMIAMALSCNPKFLIADEPTTALDVTIQAQILRLMKDLQKEYNTAIMLITHDMGVVANTADYVAVMYAGKIVEYNTIENICDAPLHPYTIGLLKSIPRSDKNINRLHTIEGILPSLTEMPEGCRFADRCKECMGICREREPELFEFGHGKVRCWKYGEIEEGGLNVE